jgi:hypothetical protein
MEVGSEQLARRPTEWNASFRLLAPGGFIVETTHNSGAVR